MSFLGFSVLAPCSTCFLVCALFSWNIMLKIEYSRLFKAFSFFFLMPLSQKKQNVWSFCIRYLYNLLIYLYIKENDIRIPKYLLFLESRFIQLLHTISDLMQLVKSVHVWFYKYMHLSKVIGTYSWNVWVIIYVNYTSIKLILKNKLNMYKVIIQDTYISLLMP